MSSGCAFLWFLKVRVRVGGGEYGVTQPKQRKEPFGNYRCSLWVCTPSRCTPSVACTLNFLRLLAWLQHRSSTPHPELVLLRKAPKVQNSMTSPKA